MSMARALRHAIYHAYTMHLPIIMCIHYHVIMCIYHVYSYIGICMYSMYYVHTMLTSM